MIYNFALYVCHLEVCMYYVYVRARYEYSKHSVLYAQHVGDRNDAVQSAKCSLPHASPSPHLRNFARLYRWKHDS